MKSEPCALFVADLHLSEKAPISRSVEQSWLNTQKLMIDQLRVMQMKYGCPVFIAGDIFNKWDNSSFFVNNVISWFRGMSIYAIPGNHDTPYHNHLEIARSSYWTLVEADVIKHLIPGGVHSVGCVNIHPYPFGFPVHEPAYKSNGLCLDVALIHDYVWVKGYGHPGADEAKRYSAWEKKLKGFDLAVFGDNHKHFQVRAQDRLHIYNCGTFLRRHSDEKSEEPVVGVLYSDGTLEEDLLDTRYDRFLKLMDEVCKMEDVLEVKLSEFASELSDMHAERVDYARTVLKWAKRDGVPDRVIDILLRVLGGKK